MSVWLVTKQDSVKIAKKTKFDDILYFLTEFIILCRLINDHVTFVYVTSFILFIEYEHLKIKHFLCSC
jgi:hypothetical protein